MTATVPREVPIIFAISAWPIVAAAGAINELLRTTAT